MNIAQYARDIILVIAGDGRILDGNPAAERAYGWSRAELLTLNIRDLRAASTVSEVPAQMQKAADEGVLFETEHRRRSGEVFTCEVSSQAAVIDGQKVLVSVIRDVSERLLAEQALHAAEERFRSLTEGSPDGIVVHRDGKLLYVNPAAVSTLGYRSADELLGRSPLDVVWPADRHLVEQRVRQVWAEGRSPTMEVRLIRRGAHEPVWAESIGLAIEYEGAPAVMVVLRDASARHKLEEQLRHAQKMEAVGRLAGGVAHDFNNILTAIIGQSELLSAELPPSTASHRHAQQVLRAAGRGALLTKQLLAFSRKQLMQPTVLDLNIVVNELDGLLRRLVGERITLSTTLASELGHVRADAAQLGQVLMNLAVNSRDAMPDGGTLSIRTEEVVHEGRRFCVLEVRDTGCGMDAETRARLFEPFFTTKPIGKGTGLGMATVYGIVTQSGGHITVESEPGAGTVFRVHLPVVDLPLERRAEEARALPRRGHETILVAEDDADVRRFLTEVLADQGYRVLTAVDGAEALDVATHEGPVQLLIADVIMPRLSGVELAGRLRGTPGAPRVLFITGYPGDTGINGPLLAKPFSVAELARQVRSLLDA